MYASAVKLSGSKVAVREFFVTLQNNVFPSVDPPTRSAHNRRCDVGDREDVGDAIARSEIKNMTQPTLKEKTARGLLWGTLSNGAQQVLTLVFGIWLARMLTPADYGMVGQLAIFSLIAATIQESGFTAALTNRPTVEHRDYNAVFWFCLPLSVTLYALLFAAAPLIAAFFKNEEITALARYLFLSFIISGLGIVPSARLFKAMRVRERTLSNLTALVVSGVAGIVLAYRGFAYWGLATQTLVYVTVNTAMYWLFAGWHPTLEWDFKPVREMVGFSSWLLLTNLLNHVNNNFFSLILGRFFDARMVGNYTQANKWNFMGHSVVTGLVNGVVQPLFVATADDVERQARVFRKMLRFTCFVAFPVMFGISIVGRELIVIALGRKWLESADMLMMLCVSGAFLPVVSLYTQYLLSRGRSVVYLLGLAAMVAVQLAVALVMYPYGVTAMLMPYVGVNVLWVAVWHVLVQRLLPVKALEAAADVLPYLAAAVGVMGFTYWSVEQWQLLPVWALAAKVAMGAALYPAVLWCCGSEMLRESAAYLFKKKKRP